MNSAEITAALGGSGACYGEGWRRCPCPAHTGQSESLSIRDGGRYGIFVKCFGGCSREQVFAAINAKLGTQFGLIKPASEDFDEIDPGGFSRDATSEPPCGAGSSRHSCSAEPKKHGNCSHMRLFGLAYSLVP
jgi:hypothetical protein